MTTTTYNRSTAVPAVLTDADWEIDSSETETQTNDGVTSLIAVHVLLATNAKYLVYGTRANSGRLSASMAATKYSGYVLADGTTLIATIGTVCSELGASDALRQAVINGCTGEAVAGDA